MTNIQLKICSLGDFAVGKTSLIRRYVEGVFDEKYLSTIGVWISRKTIRHENYEFNLILWDLAGGDNYLRHHTNYLRGAAGAILVCDLSRLETLPYIKKYAGQLRTLNPKAEIVMVGNKSDLSDAREVTDESLDGLSADLECDYFVTSAKTGSNVEDVFLSLAKQLASKRWPKTE